MSLINRFVTATTEQLGPNRVEAIAGTSARARDGHIVDMRGMDLTAFARSGTILWSHDPDQPVGIPIACRIDAAGNLRITLDFAPEGASARADEVRNLVKSGIIRNMSIGFEPIEMQPLDPNKPRGGQRITRSELLEVSFVSVPADTGAIVTARAARAGKTLSGLNAAALRQAHRLADQCRSTLAGVLGEAGEMDEPDGDEFEKRQRQVSVFALSEPPEVRAWRRRQGDVEVLQLRLDPHTVGEVAKLSPSYRARQRELRRLAR